MRRRSVCSSRSACWRRRTPRTSRRRTRRWSALRNTQRKARGSMRTARVPWRTSCSAASRRGNARWGQTGRPRRTPPRVGPAGGPNARPLRTIDGPIIIRAMADAPRTTLMRKNRSAVRRNKRLCFPRSGRRTGTTTRFSALLEIRVTRT